MAPDAHTKRADCRRTLSRPLCAPSPPQRRGGALLRAPQHAFAVARRCGQAHLLHVSSIAAARRLCTCAGMPHRGMTAGRRRLGICCRCALRASCPRIAPPERRGHAPFRRRSRHARAAAAACGRRIGDPSGARLRCDGSGPARQAPICGRYAAQRGAHAAHARRTPFASDARRTAAAAPAAVGWWGGGGGGGGGDGGGGSVGGQRWG